MFFTDNFFCSKMTLMPPTRKRNRSCGEEDFLPLSKKINNLHINNWSNIENPQDQVMTWDNRTDQWLASQHALLTNGARSEEESLDSSPFENAQESVYHGETDSNQLFDRDSCESSQVNYKGRSPEEGENPWSMVYSPDLNMDENPYYYENNKLLFELYVERLRRGGY